MNTRLQGLYDTDRDLVIPHIAEGADLVEQEAKAAGVTPAEYVKDWDSGPMGARQIAETVRKR